jgi:hypothetical protein
VVKGRFLLDVALIAPFPRLVIRAFAREYELYHYLLVVEVAQAGRRLAGRSAERVT